MQKWLVRAPFMYTCCSKSVVYIYMSKYIRCDAITYASWAQTHRNTLLFLFLFPFNMFAVHKTSIWEWVRLFCLVALWNDDVRRLISNLNAKATTTTTPMTKNSMERNIQKKNLSSEKNSDKLRRKLNPLLWHFETVLFFVSFLHWKKAYTKNTADIYSLDSSMLMDWGEKSFLDIFFF